MRVHLVLSTLSAGLLVAGLYACGSTAGGQGSPADGGADVLPVGDDSGNSPPGPCGWIGLEGLDAACGVGSDCRAGQVCLVASGCFCSSEGRCIDQPCEGGVLSTECARSECRQALTGSADPDAGVISCFVSGC